VRLCAWADLKRPAEKRIMRYSDEQILWAASYLRGDAYLRINPYITARLEAEGINTCTNKIKKVMNTLNQFLKVLAQSYKNLNKIRTSEPQLIELQLIELKQNALVPEYLIRFT
jgi:hypothetical protein